MSGEDWLAIDNVENIRVYVVDCDYSHGVDRESTIEEFADKAERLGTVYTLPYFIGKLNDYDDDAPEYTPNFKNSFIRMAVVRDGTILKEIEGRY